VTCAVYGRGIDIDGAGVASIDAQSKNEPVVISLSTLISGNGDYLAALNQFLDYAVSKDARFVTTMGLVNMSHPEGLDMLAIPVVKAENETIISSNATIIEDVSSGCAACDAEKKASINATAGNKSVSIILDVGSNRTE
jgi:hypothetical protein